VYNIQTDAGYPTTRHRRFLRPLITADPTECIINPDTPKHRSVHGEATTKQGLPHTADTREKSADGHAGARHSNRTKQIPVRLGSSTALVKQSGCHNYGDRIF